MTGHAPTRRRSDPLCTEAESELLQALEIIAGPGNDEPHYADGALADSYGMSTQAFRRWWKKNWRREIAVEALERHASRRERSAMPRTLRS